MLRRVAPIAVAVATLGLTIRTARGDERCLSPAAPEQTAGPAQDVFARGRAALGKDQLDEAATLLVFVATEHATSAVGVASASLSLDALSRRVSQGDDACLPAMRDLTVRYDALYCVGNAAKTNDDACSTFTRIRADIDRLGAEHLVRDADAEHGETARRLYLAAGVAYGAIWTASYEPACRAAKKEACARADEILFNAAKAFQAAHDHDHASAMRMTLLDPRNHLDETALASRAVYEQGAALFAIGEYAEAAEFYERFATRAPKEERAPAALSDAVLLRLTLGARDSAQRDADLFTKQYGGKKPGDVAAITVALATTDLENGDAARAAKSLEASRQLIEKARPDLAPQADVALGRALVATRRLDDARRAFRRAASVDVLRVARPDDDVAMRSLGRMLIAVGEAKLALADESRDAAMKSVVKKGDAASLAKKRAAIGVAEKQYAAILELQPLPPPGPVVAAAGRVARMRSRLWAEAYLALGDVAADPLLADAKAANVACVCMSAKFQYQDAGARACAHWLERHFPREFPRMLELAPKLGLVGDDTIPRARPLDEDSEDVAPGAPNDGAPSPP